MFASSRNPALVAALAALAVAFGAIAAAWIIEAMGYIPCELCLLGRKPYYIGIALAALTAVAAGRGQAGLARAGLALSALTFVAGVGIAAYHSGVELKFWPGPAECAGAVTQNLPAKDFLEQLKRIKPVRCDEAALRIFGLSLAEWSVLISLALGGVSAWGFRRSRTG